MPSPLDRKPLSPPLHRPPSKGRWEGWGKGRTRARSSPQRFPGGEGRAVPPLLVPSRPESALQRSASSMPGLRAALPAALLLLSSFPPAAAERLPWPQVPGVMRPLNPSHREAVWAAWTALHYINSHEASPSRPLALHKVVKAASKVGGAVGRAGGCPQGWEALSGALPAFPTGTEGTHTAAPHRSEARFRSSRLSLSQGSQRLQIGISMKDWRRFARISQIRKIISNQIWQSSCITFGFCARPHSFFLWNSGRNQWQKLTFDTSLEACRCPFYTYWAACTCSTLEYRDC